MATVGAMETMPMRKAALFAMPPAEARRLLAEAPYVHLATTTPEGRPVLRALNAAVCFDRLYFHGSPAGEKALCLGRDAVVSAEEHVAQVSSAWIDPLRACPATTFYRAVQVSGALAVERDPARKAAALQAMMEKHQPEGGYTPLDAAHPLYRKALDGILVMSVSLEGLRGKAKLGQNRSADERARIVAGLWARGLPGDALACARVLDACPDTPREGVFRAPAGLTLVPQCDRADDAADAAHLLHHQYWNVDRFDLAALVAAHRRSCAWVGARDAEGHLVASARAVSDGVKHAWVYDVVVAPGLRRSGVGASVMRLLLDHPAVRGAAQVHLGTRDAQGFYARVGFVDAAALPPRAYASTHMIRAR